MIAEKEAQDVRARYERRVVIPAERYSRFTPEVTARVHERQRAILGLLRRESITTLANLDVLEVGCGGGANLLELLELGADPGRLVGNELLEDRLALARRLLPEEVALHAGDACELVFPDRAFDIIYQSTVFSSILSDAIQQRMAVRMWHWLRPGGGILWYDLAFDNPGNRDVHGVPISRVRELFPQGEIRSRRITLAPPIGRRVCAIHPSLYSVFNALPLLRTHILCWIRKR